jgi:hypothetical protein
VPTPIDPQYYARREPPRDPWPENDPEPEVTTLDPVPDGVEPPSSVLGIVKAGKASGYEIRIGYSRARLRGQTLDTFRTVEAWSLWFDPGLGAVRPFGSYERFEDKTRVWMWSPDGWSEHEPPAGEPGTWKWARVRIGRQECSISDLKEWMSVRGSVLPAWFAAIRKRIEEKERKQKAAAKARPKKREEGN